MFQKYRIRRVWYSKVDMKTGEVEPKKVRQADTDTGSFWISIISNEKFQEYIRNRYAIGSTPLMGEEYNRIKGNVE